MGELDLPLDEGAADLGFLRRGRPVAGRAPGNDIGDVDRTPVEADRVLMEARMRAEARRRVVDKVAAAVMLQSWLDARRGESGR